MTTLVEVHYQYQDEDIPVSPNLNIFVACFTTCWARLRLYAALEPLGQRVLYYDTDSIIFLQDALDEKIDLSSFTTEVNMMQI